MPAPLRGAGIDAFRSGSSAGQESRVAMDGFICIAFYWVKARLAPERGASFVEYALLLMLIAVAALIAVKAFGQGVSTQFSTINSATG
jgi:Flp pilus assembly pilin Flp